jgi:hypothetical protein
MTISNEYSDIERVIVSSGENIPEQHNIGIPVKCPEPKAKVQRGRGFRRNPKKSSLGN